MKSFEKKRQKNGPVLNTKGHYQWKYNRRSVIFSSSILIKTILQYIGDEDLLDKEFKTESKDKCEGFAKMMIKKGLKPRLQEIPARKIPIKRGFSKFYREDTSHKRLQLTDRSGHSGIDSFRIRKRENSFDQNKVPSVLIKKKFKTTRIKRKKTLTFMNQLEMKNFKRGSDCKA